MIIVLIVDYLILYVCYVLENQLVFVAKSPSSISETSNLFSFRFYKNNKVISTVTLDSFSRNFSD